jgi:hypothetical protein
MKRILTFLFLTLTIDSPSMASVNINTELVRKSVVYVYGGDNLGKQADPTKVLGTGFLVAAPLSSVGGRAYYLLVTARHVFDPAWAHRPTSNPEWVYLRMNTKNYDPKKDESGVGFVPIHLILNQTWIHHVDENVDVAVVLLNPKVFEDYDVDEIKISDFATEEEAKQRVPSDPVLSAGPLLAYPGVKRNYPVLKFGYLSTLPDELIPSQCVQNGGSTLMRLWFLSINLLPGNSGSPIFYVPEGANNASFAGGRAALIGLQSTSFLGFDVSGMTPVQYIFETVEAMKLTDVDLYRGLPQNKPKKASP